MSSLRASDKKAGVPSYGKRIKAEITAYKYDKTADKTD